MDTSGNEGTGRRGGDVARKASSGARRDRSWRCWWKFVVLLFVLLFVVPVLRAVGRVEERVRGGGKEPKSVGVVGDMRRGLPLRASV